MVAHHTDACQYGNSYTGILLLKQIENNKNLLQMQNDNKTNKTKHKKNNDVAQ